jgi:16S rRNA processing protein RimM
LTNQPNTPREPYFLVLGKIVRPQFVMIPLRDALPLEEGEVYLFEIIGMAVYTKSGEYLGEVAEIIETGANDVYLLRGGARGEFLIPDTDEVIQSIDRATRKIVITPLIGLLPGDEIDDPDGDGD